MKNPHKCDCGHAKMPHMTVCLNCVQLGKGEDEEHDGALLALIFVIVVVILALLARIAK